MCFVQVGSTHKNWGGCHFPMRKTPQLIVNPLDPLWRLKTQTIHEMVWEPRVFQMSPVGPVGIDARRKFGYAPWGRYFWWIFDTTLESGFAGFVHEGPRFLLLTLCCADWDSIEAMTWHTSEERVNIDQESVHWISIDFWFLGRCRSLCHLLSILPLQSSVPGKLVLSGHKNKATDSSGLKRGVCVPTGSAAGSCRYLLAVPCFRF